MNRLAVIFWLLFSPFATAQTVVVQSGDHAGFTRLVIELPKAALWKMGRTAEGYELLLPDETLQFDVTDVFENIQRNRLAAIWTDPVSGALRIGVACACHAIPFEFRPGIIVIDVRDGPPPTGSSFELALAGYDTPDLAKKPTPRPRARPPVASGPTDPLRGRKQTYSWLTPSALAPAQEILPDMSLPVSAASYTDLTPLKEALLSQLSQGAAQGLVQMEQPKLSNRSAAEALPLGPRANIRFGDVPGFIASTRPASDDTLINGGAECLPDEMLNVADWGSDQAVAIQLAVSRTNLIGEFDKPNPPKVIGAVKLLIYLGFGAEARQMLKQMPVDDAKSRLWNGMAILVDGASDDKGPFSGMQTCDTAAALWSALASPQFKQSDQPQSDAILRAFSALPAHLRRSIGPRLSAKFLSIGDLSTSRSLSNSVLRATSEAGATLAVMKATLDMASGDPAAATAELEPVLAEAGPATADVLIALVDAQIAANVAVTSETAIALAALLREQKGSDLAPALQRAQILALGSSGDFDQAFALLPIAPSASSDLWTLLAKSGSGSAVLNHAVLPNNATLPTLTAPLRSQIATQLLDLGLPDAALVWIGELTDNLTVPDRILSARAYLEKGDPASSLNWISGVDDSTAAEIRAEALWQAGKPAEAAMAWARAGNIEAELRAQGWAQNWGVLAKSDASSWQAAAALLAAGVPDDVLKPSGPLALGNALVADSATVRATVSNLLTLVPGPQTTK